MSLGDVHGAGYVDGVEGVEEGAHGEYGEDEQGFGVGELEGGDEQAHGGGAWDEDDLSPELVRQPAHDGLDDYAGDLRAGHEEADDDEFVAEFFVEIDGEECHDSGLAGASERCYDDEGDHGGSAQQGSERVEVFADGLYVGGGGGDVSHHQVDEDGEEERGADADVQHVSPGEGDEVCAANEAADKDGAYDLAYAAARSVQGDGEAATVGELS